METHQPKHNCSRFLVIRMFAANCYIVSNGQPIEEMIQNIPCLRAMPQATDTNAGRIIPLLESLNLHGNLKRDLATRSPARILEKLLAGKYKQPEERQ